MTATTTLVKCFTRIKTSNNQDKHNNFYKACIYGSSIKDSICLGINKDDNKLIYQLKRGQIVSIEIDGSDIIQAEIKEIQRHPISLITHHIDFYTLNK